MEVNIIDKSTTFVDESLLKWLSSVQVYCALRFAFKNPSTVGIDNYPSTDDLVKLYELVGKLLDKKHESS